MARQTVQDILNRQKAARVRQHQSLNELYQRRRAAGDENAESDYVLGVLGAGLGEWLAKKYKPESDEMKRARVNDQQNQLFTDFQTGQTAPGEGQTRGSAMMEIAAETGDEAQIRAAAAVQNRESSIRAQAYKLATQFGAFDEDIYKQYLAASRGTLQSQQAQSQPEGNLGLFSDQPPGDQGAAITSAIDVPEPNAVTNEGILGYKNRPGDPYGWGLPKGTFSTPPKFKY
jgi:hypothetical protein